MAKLIEAFETTRGTIKDMEEALLKQADALDRKASRMEQNEHPSADLVRDSEMELRRVVRALQRVSNGKAISVQFSTR